LAQSSLLTLCRFRLETTVSDLDPLPIMGDYTRVGIMLNAVDQRQPPNRPALLPPLERKGQ